MERRCSSGSTGDRLTPAIRTDAGASKSDLRLRERPAPFQSTPASMIAGIVLVDDPLLSFFFFHHAFARANGPFSNFFPFRVQLFQNIPSTTNRNCNLSRFMLHVLFSILLFLILLFDHLGDQCAFAVIVLVSLRFFINFPPSPITTLYVYHRSLRWSRRYGHRSPHVCLLPTRCLML